MEYRVIRSNDELYHYGVKGMKWGVKRAKEIVVGKYNRTRQDFNDSRTSTQAAKTNAKKHLKRAAIAYGTMQATYAAAGIAARQATKRGNTAAAMGIVQIGKVTMKSAQTLALAEVGMASAHAALGLRAPKDKERRA